MFYNKKGAIEVSKIIITSILLGFILISFILIIFNEQSLYIDDNKIDTQLIISNMFNSKCLSEDFGFVDESKYNKENINSCFNGLKEDILVKVQISGKESIYVNNMQSEFDAKANLCTTNSNQLCTQINYPIVYRDSNFEENSKIISLIIITT